jgi:threonine dehydrogenase-like Zn-dependent dehydrogenase
MKVFINLSFHRKLIVIEKKQKTVAVFGAGIAGLTTAHKLKIIQNLKTICRRIHTALPKATHLFLAVVDEISQKSWRQNVYQKALHHLVLYQSNFYWPL